MSDISNTFTVTLNAKERAIVDLIASKANVGAQDVVQRLLTMNSSFRLAVACQASLNNGHISEDVLAWKAAQTSAIREQTVNMMLHSMGLCEYDVHSTIQ